MPSLADYLLAASTARGNTASAADELMRYLPSYRGGAQTAGSNAAIVSTEDPRLRFARSGANTAEALGMNELQRRLGLNLDPRVGIGNLYQPDLPPERRIQESFRQFPGYY